MVGEVTTLEHEVGDDTVEARALVAEALLARAESAEVLLQVMKRRQLGSLQLSTRTAAQTHGSLGDDVVVCTANERSGQRGSPS